MTTYRVESFSDVWPDVQDLIKEHWEEIALDKDVIKLDPDYHSYLRMEETGQLHIVTARDEGKLVGYYCAIIRPHLHYADSITAYTDLFFISKPYRKGLVGYKLIKWATNLMPDDVQKVYIQTKLGDRDIGVILERIGYLPVERVYALTKRK